MAKQKYAMNLGERIVFKVECVRHGFWGAYTHILIVTNQCVILEEYGMFNNFKGINRYPYNEINQAILGKASNGEKQLELYMANGNKEEFALQSGDDNILKTLSMSINDQMTGEAECYDFSYYQSIIDGTEAEIKAIKRNATANTYETGADIDFQSGLNFAGDVAKNMLKSGDISIKGLSKSITKTSKKQARKSMFGGFMDEVLDDIGVHDIQDAFTEIGNDFREEFGMKPKMTHQERRELAEKEEKRKEKELYRQKKEAYNRQVEKAKQAVNAKKAEPVEESDVGIQQSAKMSINDQLDALKKLKELLDLGILTEEEFDIKKKEILNS